MSTGKMVVSTAVGETWERTSELRIVRRPGPYGPIDKLQQAWFCRQSGKINWRDVQVVDAAIP